jgi:hypothetical protein
MSPGLPLTSVTVHQGAEPIRIKLSRFLKVCPNLRDKAKSLFYEDDQNSPERRRSVIMTKNSCVFGQGPLGNGTSL